MSYIREASDDVGCLQTLQTGLAPISPLLEVQPGSSFPQVIDAARSLRPGLAIPDGAERQTELTGHALWSFEYFAREMPKT